MRASLVAISLLAVSGSGASSATIDYSELAEMTVPELTVRDVTATGSSNVAIRIALGIEGGLSDGYVDSGESVRFSFGRSEVTSVDYFVPFAFMTGDLPSGTYFGERILEAFGSDGLSLGSRAQSGAGAFQVTSLFGDVPISAFELTSARFASGATGFAVSTLRYEPEVVPLPATAWLLLGALTMLGLQRLSPARGLCHPRHVAAVRSSLDRDACMPQTRKSTSL